MDIIQQQLDKRQGRQRKVIKFFAVICFGLLGLALTKEVFAGGEVDYVQGVNVMPCRDAVKQPLSNKMVADCRAQGQHTPHRVETEVRDEQTGRIYVAEVQATLVAKCGDTYCYTVDDRDGTPKGTNVGASVKGDYSLEVGWYLSVDSNNHPTAYREDVGPLHHQPVYMYNCAEYNECADKVVLSH